MNKITVAIAVCEQDVISPVSGRQLGVHGNIDTLSHAVSFNDGSLTYVEGTRSDVINAFTQLKFHMI